MTSSSMLDVMKSINVLLLRLDWSMSTWGRCGVIFCGVISRCHGQGQSTVESLKLLHRPFCQYSEGGGEAVQIEDFLLLNYM